MRRYLSVALPILFIAGAGSIHAATLCQQSFDLWGATAGDTVVLKYSEYVGGDCDWYRMYTITMDSTGIIDEQVERNVYIYLPLWPDSIYEGRRMQRIISLDRKDDGFYLRYVTSSAPGGVTISAPSYDSTFWPRHKEFLIGMQYDTLWKFFDPPQIKAEAELLWKSPNAVYKNYSISSVYMLFESGHLVLIINQPVSADGLDTMHGVIIYKLKGWLRESD